MTQPGADAASSSSSLHRFTRWLFRTDSGIATHVLRTVAFMLLMNVIVSSVASMWEGPFGPPMPIDSIPVLILIAVVLVPLLENIIAIGLAALIARRLSRPLAIGITALLIGLTHQWGVGPITTATIAFVIMLHSYDAWHMRPFRFRYLLTVAQHMFVNAAVTPVYFVIGFR